jgi:TAG lipase/steryl ester hydrolase/phospholipase A2/LPA acyltransferase
MLQMLLSKTRKLERAMDQANTYEEWREAAITCDEASGMDRWKRADQSRNYDFVSIRIRLDRLRSMRAKHDYHGLLFNLNEGIHGNMGGMGNSALYHRAHFGTKKLIADYVDEIVDALELLGNQEMDDISVEEKLDFFRRAHHCFGQSALMMSGSGMLLYFHVGVVKALWGQGLLPNILSGSSGGSFVGSVLATHTDDELEQIFDPEYLVHEIEHAKGIFGTLDRLRPKILEADEIRDVVERLIPDMTFQEAYAKTGRRVNVSVAPAETHQTSRLLNATTSPNVYLREAIMASAAVPGVYPPVTLAAKNKYGEKQEYLPSRRWVDGSMSDDLPAKRLARLYGVNHYIVSQTNPHIIPFMTDAKRQPGALSVIRNATTRTAREWLNASATIMRKPLAKRPRLNQLTDTVLSVINQDYVGDINILPPFRFRNPTKLLAHLPEKEIKELIEMGERSTWPLIEMIRIQTRISRTLDRIRNTYEIQTGK